MCRYFNSQDILLQNWTQVKTQNNPSTQIFKHSLQRDRLCVLLGSNFAAICLKKAVEFNPDTIFVRNSVD